ncbi:MAG: D-alanyl-D-alanine carboxypeptidase / D-alanyl-D-alanine-endopeptidase [bacterium]|nr:MAG: D-alanyl-D-alanine carboxypeptidase / D-alanyl-D-alanine-endopeptidase [bacterium]
MKKALVILTTLFLLVVIFLAFREKFTVVLFSEKNNEKMSVAKAAIKPGLVTSKNLTSLENYFTRLGDNGSPIDFQSVIIETLDGKTLVERNADVALNPASVMKLAICYLALKRFEPDHKFKTLAYTTGLVDESKQTLYGDIVIETEGDPNFTVADAISFGASIRSQGIKKVEGTLIIKGPMFLRHSSNSEYIYSKLKSAMGMRFSNTVPLEVVDRSKDEGKVLLSVHYSQPLKELLLSMNAFSDNYYAEHFGLMLGGIAAVETELETEFNLNPQQLEITHASGLDYNRITTRASVKIFQKMIGLLKSYQMKVEDIMPIVGVDSGTLATRLVGTPLLGAVAAKTGTLHVTDDGASILQGVIYTEQYGPVMFAIFNMVGKVNYFRQEQDQLLTELVAELGLTPKPVRLANIFPDQSPVLIDVKDFPEKKAYGRRGKGSRSKKHRR